MKRLYAFALVLAALSWFAPAQAQTQTTLTVVITNAPTNGQSLYINGWYRYWTNAVTNVASQIQTDTNVSPTIGHSFTNMWNAYIVYPQPFCTLTIPQVLTTNVFTNTFGTNSVVSTNIFYAQSTNVLQFQSYEGYALTASGFSNWASTSLSTVTPTNFWNVQVPVTNMGLYERTNLENGMLTLLNDTNFSSSLFVTYTNPIWRQFLGTNFGYSLTNWILTLSTNATNYASNLFVFSTNYSATNTWFYYTNSTNFANTNMTNFVIQQTNDIYNWATTNFEINGPGLSYLNGCNIVLTNTNGITRLEADCAGSFQLYMWDGTAWFGSYGASGGTRIQDHEGHERFAAWESAEFESWPGATALRSVTGNPGLMISGISDTVFTYSPVVTFSNTLPIVTMGTVLNFTNLSTNSGSNNLTSVNSNVFALNCFTNGGDTIIRHTAITFSGSGTYEVVINGFGGELYDSGTFAVTSSGVIDLELEATISTPGSSGVLQCVTRAVGNGIGTALTCKIVSPNGINFTSSQSMGLEISGPASGDAKVNIDNVRFAPSGIWATMP